MKKLIQLMCLFFGVIILKAQQPTFQWARSMGGSSHDIGYSIATDASGNIYTTGSFMNYVDFDPGVGTFTIMGRGAFISKLDPAGNFIWAKSFSNNNNYCEGTSIVLDFAGNICITGAYNGSIDFDPGPAVYNLTASGPYEVFICKLTASGDLIWAKSFGDTLVDFGSSIATDGVGNIYVSGCFEGTVDFDPGPGSFNLVSGPVFDFFVLKLNALGNFIWAKDLGDGKTLSGGPNYYGNSSIALNASSEVFITGAFSGTHDFDPGVGIFNLSTPVWYDEDIFICKLNTSGDFVWAKSMGGTQFNDYGQDIYIDGSDNIFITGSFRGSVDFDPGPATFSLQSPETSAAFISKLDPSGNLLFAKMLGGTGIMAQITGNSIMTDGAGNIYTTGNFSGEEDFDPGPGIFNLNTGSASFESIFISKLNATGDFVWAKDFGFPNSYGNSGNAVTIDPFGNVIATGFFSGANFNSDGGTFTLQAKGQVDIFVFKLSLSLLDIEEQSDKENFLIYPNPTTDFINIAMQNTIKPLLLKIINAIGQTVFETSCTDQTDMSIELSSQPDGIYLLKISDGEKISNSKIVKTQLR